MTIEFKVEGLAVLNKALRTLPKNVQRRVLNGALRAGGRVIVKAAKQRVPVKSGRLKKSIFAKTGRATEGAVLFVATKPSAFYAHMVEFGLAGNPAQPFLRPALDETRGATINAISKALGKGIIKETNRL